MLEGLTSSLKPLRHGDLRSQSTPGSHSLGSLLRGAGPPALIPVAGTDLLLRSRPSTQLSSFPERGLHFCLVLSACLLPCQLLSPLSLSIFLSFPITPIMHPSGHSFIQFCSCPCNHFSPPPALGNLSSVLCLYSCGFFQECHMKGITEHVVLCVTLLLLGMVLRFTYVTGCIAEACAPHYTTICLLFHQMIGVWVVSSLGLK